MASGWWNDYSLGCEEVDYSVSPRNERMIKVCWVYWLSKHFEFVETVFKNTDSLKFYNYYLY